MSDLTTPNISAVSERAFMHCMCSGGCEKNAYPDGLCDDCKRSGCEFLGPKHPHLSAAADAPCTVEFCVERQPHYHREDADWGEHLVFTEPPTSADPRAGDVGG